MPLQKFPVPTTRLPAPLTSGAFAGCTRRGSKVDRSAIDVIRRAKIRPTNAIVEGQVLPELPFILSVVFGYLLAQIRCVVEMRLRER